MGIESNFDPGLWGAVQSSYDAHNYTAVILESVQYLGDVVREKTGLASDGVSLVGEAFGGNKPKLRVNRFETESEKNIQSGIESMMRGVYKTFRNPRAHEKHVDSQEDANTVIVLVSYFLRVIGQARSPFEREVFIQRVFDDEFVQTRKYAELLTSEVPAKFRFDILVQIYRERSSGNVDALSYVVEALWKLLTDESKNEFAMIVSSDLNAIKRSNLHQLLHLLPTEMWRSFTDIARIRCENMLISSINEGQYDTKSEKFLAGQLGTWISKIFENALLQDDLQVAVAKRLNSGNDKAIDYIFKYIFSIFVQNLKFPGIHLQIALRNGLARGDHRFKEALGFIECRAYDEKTYEEIDGYLFEGWRDKLISAYENCEVEKAEEDDALF